MTRYNCSQCGYVYDEMKGVHGETYGSEGEVPKGTQFTTLIDNWHCPQCGCKKFGFNRMQE